MNWPAFLDLTQCMDEPHVRELLSLSVGFPTDEKLTGIARLYTEESDRQVIGIELDGALAGLLGLQNVGDGRVEILHLAVSPGQRGNGLATMLLNEAIAHFQPVTLFAETDAGAVGFYDRHGFVIESLGSERYGIERFRCTLIVSGNAD